MALLTTTIGAYPKPDYVPVPDWFQEESTITRNPTEAYEVYLRNRPIDIEAILDRATREVIEEQVNVGIDVPTDGEIRRENYIHYHCRHLDGVDFAHLTEKTMRCGAWVGRVPTITGGIRARNPFLFREWQSAQSVTDRPIKITLPGPMTIIDSLADGHYGDEDKLGQALAKALNVEIQSLAKAGCRWIQIDEPLLVREPEKALSFGIENLERCFHGLPQIVRRAVHACCGYPDTLDNEHFHKAEQQAYFQLADRLEAAVIDEVSIEDAHLHNDLVLLEHFKNTTVTLGVIGIARTRVESVGEIVDRLREALTHIDAERLIVAPDCGLAMLQRETLLSKLKNMTEAARMVV